MKDKLQWALVVIVSMALGAGIIVGIDSVRSDDGSNGGLGPLPISGNADDSPDREDSTVRTVIASDVADLVEKVRPSVVKIQGSVPGGFAGGLGSGIVLDKDGNILTNNHVVEGLGALDVVFWDGTAAPARVIGTDPGNDLAVIRVEGVNPDTLVPAVLGDSEALRVGEFVMAIGNPFDLTGTTTTGIVSGIGRTLNSTGGRPLRQLIQSDAAINPGNSGGALFNAAGEVVGVTTAIENPTGDRVFAGIGYAVPVDVVERFLPQMLAGEQVQHPRLGIQLRDLTPALAEQLGLSVDRGVIIVGVEPGSGAAEAGLVGGPTGGDVIVAMDGEPIESYEDLADFIDSKQVGDVVTVTIVRDGQEETIEVTLTPWLNNSA